MESKLGETQLPAHISARLREKLRRWANRLRGRYGAPIYLCGSALREANPDPRDWDVRIMLPDDDFALRFGPVDEWRDEGCTGLWTRTRWRWSDQCVKDTRDFAAWVHLPGDVQIYPESHAATLYADCPRVRLDTYEPPATPPSVEGRRRARRLKDSRAASTRSARSGTTPTLSGRSWPIRSAGCSRTAAGKGGAGR